MIMQNQQPAVLTPLTTQALPSGPDPTFFGSPLVTPSYNQHNAPLSTHEFWMDVVSPRLLFTPATTDALDKTLTLSKVERRACCVPQLPHERYSLPMLLARKFWTATVPAPLCWKTLSAALRAPPPLTWEVPEDWRKVAASSQTDVHHL